MTFLTSEEIIEATGGELISENPGSFTGISIDSRTISAGEIFFALKGAKFDGHDFLEDACSRGSGAVIDTADSKLPKGKIVIYVNDTLKALQDLARFRRMKQNIPVVAITGSNGKTTTKEITHRILSSRFKVLKNEGNLNNHIGLPLSLAKVTPDIEVVVLELGMNATGEIKRLCEIAMPSHGIITNIGLAHVGELGDIASIRSAKFEVLQGLAVAVLNADDSFLMEGFQSLVNSNGFEGKVLTFSINNDSNVRAENISATEKGSSFILKVDDGKSAVITLNIFGMFNIYNALAASAVCLSLGITIEEIKNALESYSAFPMRFEVVSLGNITLINDSYNANPTSMQESLKELARLKNGGRTVAILGDMAELGEFSETFHRTVGAMLFALGIDVFVAVGEMMCIAAEESMRARSSKYKDSSGLKTYCYKTSDEASQNVPKIIGEGDVVLLKGSRAMSMEKIVKGIRRQDVI